MTDADEALMWAKAPTNEQIIALAVYRWRRAGGPPADYSHFVIEVMRECWTEAYRAGAAASAERIKALEEGLSMLYDLFTHVKPSAFRNGVTDSTNTIDEGEVQAWLILDRAKALLKEPDEPTDEPTDEDRYGWGGQG